MVKEQKLGVIESRFADIIWANEPLTTSELIKLCEEKLSWKRTTTYTVLKRLSERGIFCNSKGTVISLISQNDFYAKQSQSFVKETFNGSLPAFLAAFTSNKKLSQEDISEIKKLVDSYEET